MRLSRRRFLMFASTAALAAPRAQAYRWQGTALGARAQIVLDHPRAERITRDALAEIDRLEDVFSLYRPGSHLRRLNAAGRLSAPPFELLECLATARRVHAVTGGRFDPTVQPLWQAMAQAWAAGHPPDARDVAQARAAIGFGRVRFDSTAIQMDPGQRLTLNGIAQGYIADRVARLMRAEGIQDVLVDTGEIVALGGADGRGGWPVTIAHSPERRLLTNRAIATSAHDGTVLDPRGRVGHILDPASGAERRPVVRSISISAPSAALADALSTGLSLAGGTAEVTATLRQLKDVRLENLQTDPETQ
ncbi:FAD:protein FMN transferase [Oceanibium sediminis]|uniref:FAD:protein FMN transferase n=1 Tax=Oceanibium sediminis TaxID=2026339 RepID=UPI000DD4C93C|nr:FAD:protein FMN transferase [Oceanibium sediminis]